MESPEVEGEAETEPNPLIEETGRPVAKKLPLNLFFCFSMSGVILSFLFIKLSMLFYQYFGDLEKEELNHMTFMAFMIEGCG